MPKGFKIVNTKKVKQEIVKRMPASKFKAKPAKVKQDGKIVVAAETSASQQPQFTDLPPMDNHEHKFIRGTLPGNRLIKVCRYFGCGYTVMDISQEEFDSLR